MRELSKLMNAAIRLTDSRTGETYEARIWDARKSYGKTQIKVAGESGPWFEPTVTELMTVAA